MKILTLAPIEKDLINFDLLNKKEKNYLFDYHLNVYEKISKFLDIKRKKVVSRFNLTFLTIPFDSIF